MTTAESFCASFYRLTGHRPFDWQQRLFHENFAASNIPASVDIPTGLGKTSVMAIWYLARAAGADIPRRLVYVVDRRTVVDQATDTAEAIHKHAPELRISTLRGRFLDNRAWQDDPAAPAIIVGTVDMIGSRLLFSGYGVSSKLRPYQAGLLGVDALIVLDEAHLVPPFAHLLRSIEQDAALWPTDPDDRRLLPCLMCLPLSATQRETGRHDPARKPFRLEARDWRTDAVARQRLNASKRLHLEPLSDTKQDEQLARAAWQLATRNDTFSRVVVFCDRRDSASDGGGPSAQGVKEAIGRLGLAERRAGRLAGAVPDPELLVGARRVYEREKVVQRLVELGFIGAKQPLESPAFLVATSAGEVGADIDADHMVSDLVAWERMVQRLGRVNRRGEGDAEVRVFWSRPAVKDAKAPTQAEQRALIAFRCKTVIEELAPIEGGYDASPGALRLFSEQAGSDTALQELIKAAITPEPLRPALHPALVDAWSMTSLETHTGRPDVAPWLRGWVDELPQTTVVWRTWLPMRIEADGRTAMPDKAEITDFFEAAPPHESEKLDTETYRVAGWLQEQAGLLLKRKPRRPAGSETENADSEASPTGTKDAASAPEPIAERSGRLRRDDVVALLLFANAAVDRCYTLADLAQERKGKVKEFESELAGKVVVLDARFGGLKHGLLNASGDSDDFPTADGTAAWSERVGFRVQHRHGPSSDDSVDDEAAARGWRFDDEFIVRRDEEGTPTERLVIEHLRSEAHREDARSIARPQELSVHQDRVRREMLRIAGCFAHNNRSQVAVNALIISAALHDEGKQASRWQRAFKAPRDARKFNLREPLAKTSGPIDQTLLGGFRHEFGSLRFVEQDAAFMLLPADWQEFVLHLVAAHHGQARPVIATCGCEDAPQSLLEERACAVALRFARLQKRWGPWGLAWWEALLRAADQRVSRDNDSANPTGEGMT